MNSFNSNDTNGLDYSTILSQNTLSSSLSSKKCIINDTIDADSTLKVNLDNIELNLVNYLNQEFVDLGFESIYSDKSNVNYTLLFKNSIELLQRFRRQLSTTDRIQEQYYKLDKENEFYLKRQETLKENNEIATRELANCEEKCRQLQLKTNGYTKTIKETSEENRKLQNLIEQRDKQFKHDRKKLEKDIEKLKERIQVLTTGKTKELPHLDMSETVPKRNPFGPRATWNTENSTSKKQLELYSELIKDYDRKIKELTIENAELKNFIGDIHSNVTETYNLKSGAKNGAELSEKFLNEIVQYPFENIYSKLNKDFQTKLKSINETLAENSSSNVNNNVSSADQYDLDNSMSISSINSVSESNYGLNISNKKSSRNFSSVSSQKDDVLNTTFTIESDEDDDDNNRLNKNAIHDLDAMKSKSNSKNVNKTSNNQLISQLKELELSDLKDHEDFLSSFNQLKSLNKKNAQNISVCSTISSSSSISTPSSDSCSVKTSINTEKISKSANLPEKKKLNSYSGGDILGSDAKNLLQEKHKLDQEKKLFYEQKLKLEQEAEMFRKVSKDLASKVRPSFYSK